MLSQSCFNMLSLDGFSSDRTVPGIISECDQDVNIVEMEKSGAVGPERRIVVSKQLPLKAAYKEDSCSESEKWCFDWDTDALVLQLKDGFPPETDVFYVGCLGVDVDPKEQEEVAEFLLEHFKCVPTFLNSDLINKFYHGFCKHYLWPLFHYMQPFSPSHGVKYDKDTWEGYMAANKVFADRVMEVMDPNEDYVWIHDYHLMILPTFLRKKHHKVKLGLFLHCPFPSSEVYRTLPVREEILRGILNCDLIDYARHFLSCCSRMLGLEYRSKKAFLGLDYLGRTVSIKILPVGIHMGQIRTIMSSQDTADKVKELERIYQGRMVLLGVDDLDMFKAIPLKFMAFDLLLDRNPNMIGNVVLVQILNAPRSYGTDVQEVRGEIDQLASEINQRHGDGGEYEPIVCVNGSVSFRDKVAYYAVSECVLVTAVRDGMNLVPYKYTVAREGRHQDCSKPKKSVIILSEFVGCSPSLSGAIRVNPWDVNCVAEAMELGLSMNDSEKELRHEKHYKYVESHDVAYWARSFDQDLKRACSENGGKTCWCLGIGLKTRFVALGPDFRKLSLEHIVPAYNNKNSRLILLDYDGTMMPCDRVLDRSPSPEVISVLNSLCDDLRNVVFVVSGRGRASLGQWFSPCENLGLSAEHGYFTRWKSDSQWESCQNIAADLSWKNIVRPVMEQYMEATPGSSIEHKESALVWHHEDTDRGFGAAQAKELLDHLESVLANAPVSVKSGHQIVEVKPQGVSKGVAVKNLMESMRSRGKGVDFVLCIGDDRSDEDMFEAIAISVAERAVPEAGNVFACTVGQKPSMAKYYVDNTFEVINMLEGLSATRI